MSIIKKTFDSVVNKAQANTVALGLETQRKAKEYTITQNIQQLKLQRDNIYNKLGQKSFELYLIGNVNQEDLEEFYSLLVGIKNSIQEQELLLEEINKKWEEEIELLKGSATSNQNGKCPTCGSAFTKEIDLFCRECGGDLRGGAAPADHVACPECHTEYNPDTAVFCKKCGYRLKEA